MTKSFGDVRAAVLDLIALRNERLETMREPAPDYREGVVSLEYEFVHLLELVSDADMRAIGEYWREALAAFRSAKEEVANYSDTSLLLYILRLASDRDVGQVHVGHG